MFSTKGRYALRIMVDIALNSHGNYISLKDISARQEVSVKYLEQVTALLTRDGLLQSLRGSGGGYRLAKKPEEYTAGEILRAAEGSLAPVACLKNGSHGCERRDKCSTIEFWEGCYNAINDYVDSVTLSDLVKNGENHCLRPD